MVPTHDSLIEAAHRLAGESVAVAREAELARRPNDDVMAHAGEWGIFDLMSPHCYGGAELDLDTFFEVSLALAAGDASHAWVITFCIEHVWMFCQFPEAFQKELFEERSWRLAPAMLSPSGQATPVPGGYELSGRWQWATGIVHGEWVIAGAIVPREDAKPEAMFFALPRDAVTVDDTWHMDGMCGTGSHDVVIDNVHVSDDQAVSIRHMMGGRAPGASIHPGPLYSTPMAPILSFAASLPILGQAKRCVSEFSEQLTGRYDLTMLEAQSTKSGRQTRLAEADLEVVSAEALLRTVLADVMEHRAEADEARRVRWTASISHGVDRCQRAVNLLSEVAGASAHQLANPLQRIRRDVNAMASHMVFDHDERRRSHGRALLGLPAESVWH